MYTYSHDFYLKNSEGSRRSAREVVPLVLNLVQPESVVDVGCGTGTWLSIFEEAGVKDILGVDGEWVDKGRIEIPQDKFIHMDLTKPVRMERQFDLVVSLEVAEHLPQDCARGFVDSLTGLGPVILFSAAIPYQGGTHHVNEQWPDYWVRQFRENGYLVIDALRKKIWENANVEYCYAQNLLLFAHEDYLETSESLQREFQQTVPAQLCLVHPRKYLEIIDWHNRIHLMNRELSALLGPEGTVILVDEDYFRPSMVAGRRILPFLEKDGQYWGPPPDDETAIREFERLRLDGGAGFIVFAWPAFWWLEFYGGFHQYLKSRFSCVLENSRLIGFDLRS